MDTNLMMVTNHPTPADITRTMDTVIPMGISHLMMGTAKIMDMVSPTVPDMVTNLMVVTNPMINTNPMMNTNPMVMDTNPMIMGTNRMMGTNPMMMVTNPKMITNP